MALASAASTIPGQSAFASDSFQDVDTQFGSPLEKQSASVGGIGDVRGSMRQDAGAASQPLPAAVQSGKEQGTETAPASSQAAAADGATSMAQPAPAAPAVSFAPQPPLPQAASDQRVGVVETKAANKGDDDDEEL